MNVCVSTATSAISLAALGPRLVIDCGSVSKIKMDVQKRSDIKRINSVIKTNFSGNGWKTDNSGTFLSDSC